MRFVSLAAKKVTKSICKSGIIANEDYDLYQYGVEQALIMFINFVSTLLIGLFLNMILQSIVFMISYIPLRSYAGGFHASTPWRCYGISLFIIAAVLSWLKFVPFLSIGCIVAIIIGSVLCFVLAPVEDKNKPLDEKEQRVFKKRAYLILIIEICISAAMYFVWKTVFEVISLAIFVEGIMLVLGKIKNIRHKISLCA